MANGEVPGRGGISAESAGETGEAVIVHCSVRARGYRRDYADDNEFRNDALGFPPLDDQYHPDVLA